MSARRVHVLAGFAPAGRRVRAACACGYLTTPRVDEARAARALESEHASGREECDRCGRDRRDAEPAHRWRHDHLRLLVGGEPVDDVLAAVLATRGDDGAWLAWHERDQVLVCRDELEECARLAEQRTRVVDLDDAPPGRRLVLRLIPGGGAPRPRRSTSPPPPRRLKLLRGTGARGTGSDGPGDR